MYQEIYYNKKLIQTNDYEKDITMYLFNVIYLSKFKKLYKIKESYNYTDKMEFTIKSGNFTIKIYNVPCKNNCLDVDALLKK